MARGYHLAVCTGCRTALGGSCTCEGGVTARPVTVVDLRDVEPLVDAVRDTLCDDELCARCDHLRAALQPFTDQDNNQGGKQC